LREIARTHVAGCGVGDGQVAAGRHLLTERRGDPAAWAVSGMKCRTASIRTAIGRARSMNPCSVTRCKIAVGSHVGLDDDRFLVARQQRPGVLADAWAIVNRPTRATRPDRVYSL
jgi:hypothetical protein